MSGQPETQSTDLVSDEDLRELRDLWMSRVMFNQFVGWPPETRSFDEFVRDITDSGADAA